MRRRTWYMVETFDLLYSFQYGMPTAIHDEDMDVLPPKNLADDDFDETTAVLPPERPFSEFTQALYFAFKSRTIRLLRRVIRHALNEKTATDYEATLALAAELKAGILLHAPPIHRAKAQSRHIANAANSPR